MADDLFQDLEQVAGEEDSPSDTGKSPIKQILNDTDTFTEDQPRSRIGLGLAMVARFVQLRDGQLRMKSKKGKGTVVTLHIPWLTCSEPVPAPQSPQYSSLTPGEPQQIPESPMYSPSTPSAAMSPLVPQTQPPTKGFFDLAHRTATSPTSPLYSNEVADTHRIGGKRIMVVAIADDNAINLQVLKRRLEMMGNKVYCGRDGRECFEIFREQHESMQFVLMDIDMPLGMLFLLYFPLYGEEALLIIFS
jgi:CheY-like chemotaxis protein